MAGSIDDQIRRRFKSVDKLLNLLRISGRNSAISNMTERSVDSQQEKQIIKNVKAKVFKIVKIAGKVIAFPIFVSSVVTSVFLTSPILAYGAIGSYFARKKGENGGSSYDSYDSDEFDSSGESAISRGENEVLIWDRDGSRLVNRIRGGIITDADGSQIVGRVEGNTITDADGSQTVARLEGNTITDRDGSQTVGRFAGDSITDRDGSRVVAKVTRG